MYTTHFMHPEKRWGVFCDGVYVMSFVNNLDAQNYCDKMNGAV